MISLSYYKPCEDKNLVKFLKTYLNKNPCCTESMCRHPKKQSNSFLFNSKRKSIKYLKEQFYNKINDNLKKYQIVEEKFWVLSVEKNKPTPAVWHHHYQEKYKGLMQISGITYITETQLGTEFDTDLYNITIKPKPNCWFFWDSSLLHRPMIGIQDTDRYVIAAQVVIKT